MTLVYFLVKFVTRKSNAIFRHWSKKKKKKKKLKETIKCNRIFEEIKSYGCARIHPYVTKATIYYKDRVVEVKVLTSWSNLTSIELYLRRGCLNVSFAHEIFRCIHVPILYIYMYLQVHMYTLSDLTLTQPRLYTHASIVNVLMHDILIPSRVKQYVPYIAM